MVKAHHSSNGVITHVITLVKPTRGPKVLQKSSETCT